MPKDTASSGSRGRRRWIPISLLTPGIAALAIGVASSSARADDAFSLSSSPIPASDAWKSYVHGDDASAFKPVAVSATGNVTNAQALVDGSGTATLTYVAGPGPADDRARLRP